MLISSSSSSFLTLVLLCTTTLTTRYRQLSLSLTKFTTLSLYLACGFFNLKTYRCELCHIKGHQTLILVRIETPRVRAVGRHLGTAWAPPCLFCFVVFCFVWDDISNLRSKLDFV